MENFQNFIKASKVSVWYGKLIDIEGASVIMSSAAFSDTYSVCYLRFTS